MTPGEWFRQLDSGPVYRPDPGSPAARPLRCGTTDLRVRPLSYRVARCRVCSEAVSTVTRLGTPRSESAMDDPARPNRYRGAHIADDGELVAGTEPIRLDAEYGDLDFLIGFCDRDPGRGDASLLRRREINAVVGVVDLLERPWKAYGTLRDGPGNGWQRPPQSL